MSLALASCQPRSCKSRRTKLDTVLSADGTTVDDPSSVCDRLGNRLGEPASDIDVSFLSLLDRCDFAGTDSPNGFVGNDNVPGPSAPRFIDGVYPSQKTTHFQADSGISPAIAFNCLSTTSLVLFPSLSSRDSPTQAITPKPASTAALTFSATNLSVSPNMDRRSE